MEHSGMTSYEPKSIIWPGDASDTIMGIILSIPGTLGKIPGIG
jgi:hypothetical protein